MERNKTKPLTSSEINLLKCLNKIREQHKSRYFIEMIYQRMNKNEEENALNFKEKHFFQKPECVSLPVQNQWLSSGRALWANMQAEFLSAVKMEYREY